MAAGGARDAAGAGSGGAPAAAVVLSDGAEVDSGTAAAAVAPAAAEPADDGSAEAVSTAPGVRQAEAPFAAEPGSAVASAAASRRRDGLRPADGGRPPAAAEREAAPPAAAGRRVRAAGPAAVAADGVPRVQGVLTVPDDALGHPCDGVVAEYLHAGDGLHARAVHPALFPTCAQSSVLDYVMPGGIVRPRVIGDGRKHLNLCVLGHTWGGFVRPSGTCVLDPPVDPA